MQQKKEGAVGPFIGILIILAVMIIGGIYFLNKKVTEIKNPPQNTTITIDETNNLQNDLNASDPSNLGGQMGDINAVLK